MSPKIFITGGNGFVGSEIYNFFISKNFPVIKISHSELISKDIYVSDQFIGFSKKEAKSKQKTFLINCASATPQNTINKFSLWENNMHLILSVSEFIILNNIDYVINLSSIESYGLPDKTYESNYENLNEDMLFDKFTLYGASKLASETILNLLSRKNKFKIINLRLPGIVGKNSLIKPVNFISQITKKIIANDAVTVLNQEFLFNNIIHTSTLCNCIECFFDDKFSEIYNLNALNLASKMPLRIDKIVNLLKDELFSASKVKYLKDKKIPFQININNALDLNLPILSTEDSIYLFLDSLKKINQN